MKKLKELKLRYYAALALVLLLGAGAAVAGVKAFQASASKTVIVQGDYIEAASPIEQVVEPELGAVTGPSLPNPNCQNDLCTWTVVQTWVHGSTTIASIPDPWQNVTGTNGGVVLQATGGLNYTGSSTTVDLVRVIQTTAATSSYSLACGPSTGATAKGQIELAKYLVSSTGFIATGTLGIIENNMTGAQGNRQNGGTVAKVSMGPQDPYFVCWADENADGIGGIFNADATTTGKIIVRFNRYIR